MTKKEYLKQYYIDNKKEIDKKQKEYNVVHKEERKEYEKQWRIKNKKKVKKHKKEYNEKHKNQRKEYLNKNKEKIKIVKRKYDKLVRFKNHNITEEQYIEIFNKQKGRCNICGKHQDELKTALHIDHNHLTGKIRGLLCMKCNRGIGYLNDNIDLLLKAIDHLNL